MEELKYFFDCYFNQTFGFDELDKQVIKFKTRESENLVIQFIIELNQIIDAKSYNLVSAFIDKHSDFSMNCNETEKFINYLYDKLSDRPTSVKGTDFKKKYAVVLCPICTQDSKLAEMPKIIYKAIVIDKNIEIFICKLCNSVWLDKNDIQIYNGQDYKNFMKANGLNGWWKELKDVDFL